MLQLLWSKELEWWVVLQLLWRQGTRVESHTEAFTETRN